MTRDEILERARAIISVDRQSTHGDPERNFERIAEYWLKYLGKDIEPIDVAVMMTLFKIARIQSNPTHPDSWIDAIGYLACGAEIALKDGMDK